MTKAFGALSLVVAGSLLGGCLLGNVTHDDCTSDDQCALAFGTGSQCKEGFCTTPTNPGCEKRGPDGQNCFSCTPSSTPQFENACTNATCAPFDNKTRLTKLNPDGSLPPLPP
jgi:hypothetical protein